MNKGRETPKLKTLNKKDPIPKKFWLYNVNHITMKAPHTNKYYTPKT